MASYPGSIPSLTRPSSGQSANDGSATDATVVVDAISDEVEAIAAELGTDPAGASATVKARLDALDSTVAGKAASAHTHALDDLSDVTVTAPSNGQVLKFNGTAWVNDTDATGGGGVSDGDKGDITVSGGGATWTVDNNAVTYAKMQDVSATARVLGRKTAGAGDVEELSAADLTTLAGGTTASTLAVGNHTHTYPYSGSVSFGVDGAVTTRTGKQRIYNDSGRTRTIVSVRASVDTAPTGASLIVDVHKNGTTIFGTQSARPTIAVSTNANKSTGHTVTTWPDGEYLTVDVDQVGSTVAGSDLAVTVEWS